MTVDQASATFRALGTTAFVAVADPAGLAAARQAVEGVVDQFDDACSRFREDSELSELNRRAGGPVAVGELLLDAVQQAMRAARLTDGDVDPTVGRTLIALGYDRDFAAVRHRSLADGATGSPVSVTQVPGWQAVTIDSEASTIRLPAGVALDLGATAKALAADGAALSAGELAGCGVLVSLGGDIAVAGSAPEGGWRVRVTDDHRMASGPGQWVTIVSGGLASSSTTVRRWDTAGGEAHHLIDPHTRSPAAAYWRTVSVAAGSCLDANIASTAAIVRGEPAAGWLEALGLPSRLVRLDGQVRHVAGWPAEGDELPVLPEPAPQPAGLAVPRGRS
jgi:FAD:protein FMN transferase